MDAALSSAAPRPLETGGRLVLGIMSGTSMDSVDYALCEITPTTIALRDSWQVAFPKALQHSIRRAAADQLTAHGVGQLHHDLGRFYAAHARRKGRKPDLIGLHGQTVYHQPQPPAATLQLGEPAYLAEELNVKVISNFRAADLAAGGQGAPLATLFHQFVFARGGRHVCVNNLGGISNVTSLDCTRVRPRIVAFDTGPANVLLDLAVQRASRDRDAFDRNGERASRGLPDERLLKRWLAHPYFRRSPPKSTGRELFGESFLEREAASLRRLPLADRLATLSEFTARSIALNYHLHLTALPAQVILAGGGAANGDLVGRIRRCLQSISARLVVSTSDEWGWPYQTIEAAAFALLAFQRAQQRPGNLPATTGARGPRLLGQITNR